MPSLLSDLSDAELVTRAREGDAGAFGELYERYLEPIYRYVYYKVGSTTEAEDLTETVFLKAWEALDRYHADVNTFMGWVYRIAHNVTVDYYRAQARRQLVPLDEQLTLGSHAADPAEHVRWTARVDELREALAHLQPSYQQVVLLRFVSELSHAETAHVMNQSEGAVRVLQFRALKALRAWFGTRDTTR